MKLKGSVADVMLPFYVGAMNFMVQLTLQAIFFE